MPERVTVETLRFGRIDGSSVEVIRFPELPGFSDARRFLIRQHDRGSVFAWLVCVDIPDLAFVIVNPWHFFPDYSPEIGSHQLAEVEAKDTNEIQIVSIVTVGKRALSLNLAGPILINPVRRKGLQVILGQASYSTSALVPLVCSGEANASRDETNRERAASPGAGG